MTNSSRWLDYLKLHFAIFMWGAAGVSSKLMSLSAAAIVFYRSLIAALILILITTLFYQKDKVNWRERIHIMASGALLGLAWFCFFQSILLSTVSIGVVSLAIAPIFIVFIEPFIQKSRFQPTQFMLSFISLIGVLIMFGFETRYMTGLLVGLLAAFLDACYTIATARLGSNLKIIHVSRDQMIGAALVIALIFILREGNVGWLAMHGLNDILGVLFLGILCSALAMSLYVEAIKNLSGFTAALSLNLEALYGIMLALILFGQKEVLSPGFYIGAVLLLCGVVMDGWLKSRK